MNIDELGKDCIEQDLRVLVLFDALEYFLKDIISENEGKLESSIEKLRKEKNWSYDRIRTWEEGVHDGWKIILDYTEKLREDVLAEINKEGENENESL
tara:strand:- start:97 stop:390 length:294 start_codon:yes stop_codon:yes gene_type:complete